MDPRNQPGGIRNPLRLLFLAYALALAHVALVFTIGEPYPSLQGPLFAGHLQVGRTIHVPFFREDGAAPSLPSRDTFLRHETLAIPAQEDFAKLAPSLSGRASREFLIGHSLRSPALRHPKSDAFAGVRWSAWTFHAPLHAPPTRRGEADLLADE